MTRSLDELLHARRANDDSRVHSRVERTRNPISISPDRYGDVVRTSTSRADNRTRNRRPPSTRSGNAHGYPKSPAGPEAELDLVFPPPPEPLVDSHGGQRFHAGRILSHRDRTGSGQVTLAAGAGTHYRLTYGNLDPS